MLLADDHAEILPHTTTVLAGDFENVGSVADGLELIEATARLDPDVVVLDITMPVLDGIVAATQLKQAGFRAQLVFLGVREDPDCVCSAMEAGGTGYVGKTQIAPDLVPAVHEALAGHRYVSATISAEAANQQS